MTNNFSQAVRQALKTLADQTSLRTLVSEAFKYYTGEVEYQWHTAVACTVRNKWRKEQKISRDCRTYEGQPRRNMLNDDNYTKRGWKLLTEVVNKVGLDKVGQLLGEFHSIDQLRELTTDIAAIKKAA